MKSLLFAVVISFASSFSQAQDKFGIRASVGIYNLSSEDQFMVTPENRIEYKLSFMRQHQSKAIGLFFQKKIGFVYLQPEFLYRITSVEYELTDYMLKDYAAHKMRERSHFFHIPITAGIHFKDNVRMGAGPVFNFLLERDSPMEGMHRFSEKQSNLSYGFQAGMGYDYKMIFIDLKYEFSFTKLGESIYYMGQRQSFSMNPNMLNFSIGVAF